MRFPPQESLINSLVYRNKAKANAREFTGMNPCLLDKNKIDPHLKQMTFCTKPFIFDSDFESGNLDMAIQTKPRDFELYMRVDTNTRGHHQWFFFSV